MAKPCCQAPVQSARFVNLNEAPTDEEPRREGSAVLLAARPFQIITLEIGVQPGAGTGQASAR